MGYYIGEGEGYGSVYPYYYENERNELLTSLNTGDYLGNGYGYRNGNGGLFKILAEWELLYE